MTDHLQLVSRVTRWFAREHRDLPWRRPEAGAWGVVVSEFMLQQTPVSRVLPVYERWMERWPTPSALAMDSAGEAVRMWGRLGYPRRALRLHAAAVVIDADHDGVVPADYDLLRALPGVGDYTAAAIASFAFGRRHVVLDTNIRRVLARTLHAAQYPSRSVTAAERRLAEGLLPGSPRKAAQWAAASMELGALVCTAAGPSCDRCPISDLCAWRAAGYPEHDGPPRVGQAYAGTDRQCRGRLLAVLRESDGAVSRARIDEVWEIPEQRERCLRSLLDDGLVTITAPETYALPG